VALLCKGVYQCVDPKKDETKIPSLLAIAEVGK